eukprot:1154595-Pelagomonas_calceolata.AAC.2
MQCRGVDMQNIPSGALACNQLAIKLASMHRNTPAQSSLMVRSSGSYASPPAPPRCLPECVMHQGLGGLHPHPVMMLSRQLQSLADTFCFDAYPVRFDQPESSIDSAMKSLVSPREIRGHVDVRSSLIRQFEEPRLRRHGEY